MSMINFDFIDRRETIATAAYVCWHCDDPTCAQVCPADAIKKDEDGIVAVVAEAALHRLLQLRAGLPVRHSEDWCPKYEQMMKCDMCYDRTSVGKRPMCATVCPSQALAYVPPEDDRGSRREKPVNTFYFGNQKITTKVYMMAPAGPGSDCSSMSRTTRGRENHELVPHAHSATPLWQDEFSVLHRRRALRQPPAVHQIPDV